MVAGLAEIKQHGITGMRVSVIAKSARCPLSSMYRAFGSRDGLLAELLHAIYEESFEEQFNQVRLRLGGTGPLSIEDIVESIPLPHSENSSKFYAMRSQVLAVAGSNPILRAKMSESLRQRRRLLAAIVEDVTKRLPQGVILDGELVTVFVFNLNWQYNDFLGDLEVSNDQYKALLRRVLVKK